jgi:hypothetical protein
MPQRNQIAFNLFIRNNTRTHSLQPGDSYLRFHCWFCVAAPSHHHPVHMADIIHVVVLNTSSRRELDSELASEFGENSTLIAFGNIFLNL